MLRHIPQPLDTGGLVGCVGFAGADINPTHDGIMDDNLFLLFKQCDQLFTGTDVAVDTVRGVVEKANDGGCS